jgi:hypothetical protein
VSRPTRQAAERADELVASLADVRIDGLDARERVTVRRCVGPGTGR